MTDDAREYAMELLAIMVIADRAHLQGKSQEEVFSEFRKSRTFASLFDPESGLWMNGPDYISDEYDIELKQKRESN